MDQSNFKNMVILKNLPSNIVEEAIVILKSNKKVKEVEKIENNRLPKSKFKSNNDNNYVVKEAEMLVSKYISKIEEKRKQKQIYNKKIDRKYKRIKKYAYISSLIIILESIIIFIK